MWRSVALKSSLGHSDGLLPHLLVVGEAAHDSGVDDAVERHGQRVDGERAVAGLLLHQVAQLLVGLLHRLHGVLQRADLLLHSGRRRVRLQRGRQSPGKTSAGVFLTTETDLTSNHLRIPGKR